MPRATLPGQAPEIPGREGIHGRVHPHALWVPDRLGKFVMREEAGGFVYILASARNGTLYTGSARDLSARVQQHREGVMAHFTRKYGVTRLVWFEAHDSVAGAYRREQLIKRWRRGWKLELIEKFNPRWEDLFPSIAGVGPPLEFVLQSKITLPRQAPDLIRRASGDPER